jgi:hypothetical protein
MTSAEEDVVNPVICQFKELSIHERVEKWMNENSSDVDSTSCENNIVLADKEYICPCWPSLSVRYCRANCPFQTSKELEKLCYCSANNTNITANCKSCLSDFRSKRFLVRALTLECSCYDKFEYEFQSRGKNKRKYRVLTPVNRLLARDCEKCIVYVKRLLDCGKYPACFCKDKNSTCLFVCRPYCKWRVNDIYKEWFSTTMDGDESILTVWQKPEKIVLPTCSCWIPNVHVKCTAECEQQTSTVCSQLYYEACECKASVEKSPYKISDDYCWIYRCKQCTNKNMLRKKIK